MAFESMHAPVAEPASPRIALLPEADMPKTRFNAGKPKQTIHMPTDLPTCCAFGGLNLDVQ